MSLSITPYLAVSDASSAIDFYCDVFGGKELYRLTTSTDQKIAHAEIAFGESKLMLADEHPNFGASGPNSIGGTPVKIQLMVDDVDAVFSKAIAVGAIELRPVKDQFHGHRSGLLQDPWGHQWFVQTKVEDVSAQDIQNRWKEFA